MTIKLVVGGFTLNIISGYAPQAVLDEEVKRHFWEDLDEMVRCIPHTEKFFIGGDFSDNMGATSGGYDDIHGSFGFGDRNGGGMTKLDFARAFDLIRATFEAERTPINFTPKLTTKQVRPAVVFQIEEYIGTMATRCKYTVVGKFSNTMPRMDVIGRSFVNQTELKGGVKIAHFNSKIVYIDIDNEYDHAAV
ncbi:uncharacterized protein LOC142180768 [Nicotiana tabacum]|uniref:Uncharacterized protein LOC142180768 n=1 Tax=Nicotiana tabacum TaxID=4097 RepID=A0AC58UHH4_TOBAC